MAVNTIDTVLKYKVDSAYVQLCPIKDYPDLIGVPNTIETTTLDDDTQTFIEGVKSNEQKTFTANFDKTAFTTIEALTGEQDLQLCFGTNSGDTTISFKGYVSVSIIGKGVDEVREMQIIITPTTGYTVA